MSATETSYRVRLETMRAELRTMRRELSSFADCPRCASTAEDVDRILHDDELAAKLGAT